MTTTGANPDLIVKYMLGKTTDKTGLDVNGDGKINITDVIKCLRTMPPAAPTKPNPADQATGVGLSPTLDWADGLRATVYRLYLWKNSTTRPAATPAQTVKTSQFKPATPRWPNRLYTAGRW